MKLSLPLLCALLSSALVTGCVSSRAQTKPAPLALAPAKPETKALLQKFLTAPYFWQQAEIGEKLAILGDKSVIPALAERLQSSTRDERINAGRVLAALGEERGFFAVLSELKDTGPRAVPAGGPLNSHGLPDVARQTIQDRYQAAGVLGRLGDRRATPALIEALQDPTIDYQAALALGQLNDERAVPALLAALERPRAKVYSPNTDIKIYAGAALLALKQPQGLPALAKVIRSSQHTIARRNAIELLGSYGDKSATPVLLEALTDKSVAIRVTAITALGAIGDPDARPALRKARADTNPAKANARLDYHVFAPKFAWFTVSQAASRALNQIGESSA